MNIKTIRDLIEESLWEYQEMRSWNNIENIEPEDDMLIISMSEGSKFKIIIEEV